MLIEKKVNRKEEQVEEENLNGFASNVEHKAIGHLNVHKLRRMEEGNKGGHTWLKQNQH